MTENSNLELAPDELVIPLKVTLGNNVYRVRHRLRPPSAEDWYAYDAALALAVEEVPLRQSEDISPRDPGTDGAGLSRATASDTGYKLELQSTEAAALLWDRLARAIEGYSFAADANWHDLVPLAHKEAAIRALTLVAPANFNHSPSSPVAPATGFPDSFPLQAEEIPAILEAIVAGRAYPRLLHIFRPPTADDERLYRRLLAETFLVRGARATRTLIPSRLRALCRLYDRLILSVEGYCLKNQPLASRDQLLEHMDAWHKRVAVQALFGEATESAPQSVAAQEINA